MNWREFSGCIKNRSALLPAVVMIWEVSRASLSTYLDMDVFKGWVFHVKIINPLVLSPCQQRALSLLLAGGVGRTLCASNAAGDGRSPPLFATESTRVRTENRTRGALVFFTFTKNHTRNQHFCFLSTKNYLFWNFLFFIITSIIFFSSKTKFEGFQDANENPRAMCDSEVFLIKMACCLGGRSGNGQWGRYPLSGTRACPSLPLRSGTGLESFKSESRKT